MKLLRTLIFLFGVIVLVLAFGFIFRVPLVLRIWPWEDGRYSYLFIGSILAAVSVAALWIGWSGEFGALPAGALNVFVIELTTSAYFFQLAAQGQAGMFSYGMFTAFAAVASLVAFFWGLRIPLVDPRPMPRPVKISFWIFILSLFLAGGALVLKAPIFPWALKPDTSVIFGCIFLGDAFYFLYGIFRPHWHHALGQLLSFLVYDLVLIVPFVGLLGSVEPGRMLNLVVYTAVLIYSGGLAVYYLFISPDTRMKLS
ncbi:MAG TPA: hypothetical protein PKL78_05045 [Anaerolineales bacterium]|nr:hypothetical protein [Anaerolineales bacterium]